MASFSVVLPTRSFSQNLCIDLVSKGYLKTYTFMFKLLHDSEGKQRPILPRDDKEREKFLKRYETESSKNEYFFSESTLIKIQNYMIAVEEADRKLNIKDQFKTRTELAFYFESLSLIEYSIDNFRKAALLFGKEGEKNMQNANMEIESAFNLGRILESHGKPEEALEYLSRGRDIARGHGIKVKEFELSKQLATTLINLGSQKEKENGNNQEVLKIYLDALKILNESCNDLKVLYDTHFAIGKVLEVIDLERSKEHYQKSLDLAIEMKDLHNECQSRSALSKYLEKTGNSESAVNSLMNFISKTSSEDKIIQFESSYQLGLIQKNAGNNEMALQCFKKCFDIFISENNQYSGPFEVRNKFDISMVMVGLCSSISREREYIEKITDNNLEAIISWKNGNEKMMIQDK